VTIPADDAAWLALVRSSMPPFWRTVADGTGGRIWERDGVTAAIVPASPNRSFFNSVLYDDRQVLIESIEELARLYEDAGVGAWTVWVPEQDTVVAEALREAGHSLDATPRAMAMPLADLKPPEPDPELEIREEVDYALLSRINEIAYGFATGEFPVIQGEFPALSTYFGSIAGETVGCAGTFAHGSDSELVYVAVLPEARGRGISGRLSGGALADAAERGFETTTLQATKLGFPVYETLGYADYGELQMWERRRAG
jgi:GNAT superfamily N-acetyltransferase